MIYRKALLSSILLGTISTYAIAESSRSEMPDLSALKYYAQQGNQAHLAAELARLEVFYPNWKVPSDLDAILRSDAEQELWQLYSTDDLDAVRRAMEKRLQSDPSWRPSDDLLKKIAEKESRNRLVSASNNKQWKDVLTTANATPELINDTDIDVLWRVAEAYSRTDQFQNAHKIYATALSSFKEPGLQKATLLKAGSAQPLSYVVRLLDEIDNEVDLDIKNEFNIELTRTMLSSAAAGTPVAQITLAHHRAFENHIKLGGKTAASDAALLGWYHSVKGDGERAFHWFQEARKQGEGSLKTLEGSLIALGKMDEATIDGLSPRQVGLQLLGEKWRGNHDLTIRYVELALADFYSDPPSKLAPDFIKDYAHAVRKVSSPEGAEALGWYAYNIGQIKAAKSWFEKALSWRVFEGPVYGLGLLAILQKDKSALAELKAKYPDYKRLTEMVFVNKSLSLSGRSSSKKQSSGRIDPIVAAYRRGDYASCLQSFEKQRTFSADQLQMKGWCLLGAERPSEAAAVFAQAAQRSKKGKNYASSQYGEALASLRVGQTNRALRLANNGNLNAEQAKTVSIEALNQRARAAFNNRDYAASIYALNLRSKLKSEPRDLMLLRGWANYHLGRLSQAKRLFVTLDAQLSTRETRHALAQFRKS